MNGGGFDMRAMPSFAHVLAERAQHDPDRVALRFREPRVDLTYGELHARASGVAVRLAESARPGERAVLLLPPGLDYVAAFFGCLYAGVVAVPTYPPLDQRQLPRLLSVLADAEPSVVLTLGGLTDMARESLAAHAVARRLRWLAVDDVPDADLTPPPGADRLAFLQYTSGSTSEPKGTMVSNANLLDNSEAIRTRFGHTEDSVGVIWLPPYHDMGLIGGVLQPVYAGFPVLLMSPLEFLANPYTWLAEISAQRATTSGGPNFAFDLCVRKIPEERRAELDLSSWTVAFCGAEPVRAATLDRFAEAFGPHGFAASAWYPCYGLAESTLIAAGGRKGGGFHERPVPPSAGFPTGTAVSCGTAIPGHRMEIREPGTERVLADGEIGEVCVSGPSIATGYWKNSGEAARTFETGADGERVLRTGDLGFLAEGELYLAGRLKDLVIVRGRNLPAEDVEHALGGCHPAIRPGAVAAFEVDTGAEQGLAVLIELTTGDPSVLAAVTSVVQSTLVAAFGVRAERVLLGHRGIIPKTSSGKVRRGECRKRHLDGTLKLFAGTEPAAPESPSTATRIAALAAEVAGNAVDPTVALTSVGLDSVRAAELRHRAHAELGLDLPLREILTGASALDLADRSRRSGPAVAPEVDRTLLSDAEQGLWLAGRLSGDADDAVLTIGLDLDDQVDDAVLTRTVAFLAERHPALHTYFPDVAGKPCRKPAPRPLAVTVDDLGAVGDSAFDAMVAEHAEAAIDPSAGVPWRVSLVRRPGEAVLVVCAHHMACDIWSLDVLAREFDHAYRAFAAGGVPTLPPAGDPALVAAHRATTIAGPRGAELAEFWRSHLRDVPSAAGLPQARPHRGTAPAARFQTRLAGEAGVRDLARAYGVTLYPVLLAAFAITAYRYTGERRFVLGMPVHGRTEPESAAAIGYFVNPLPLVCEVDPAEDFATHVRRFGALAAAAQAHQEYPLQRMPADRGRDLIRTVLAHQQAPSGTAVSLLAGERTGTGVVRCARFVAQRTAPFELTVEVLTTGGGLDCAMTYDTEALTEADVAGLAGHWARALASAVADPALRPDEIDLLDDGERARLLAAAQPATATATQGAAATLTEAVLARCRTHPDLIAVSDVDGELSYGELDRRSAVLAARLLQHRPDGRHPVAVLLPRGRAFVVAMLAAHRAGAPYLPLDIGHPDDRLATILADAAPAVIVTDATTRGDRADLLRERSVVVESDVDRTAHSRLPDACPDSPAYVIYTSGSTGTPKGVACAHRGVLTLLADLDGRAALGPGDTGAWWTSPGFDVSVLEVYSALTGGARLAVSPERLRHDAGGLAGWLAEQAVTSAYLPPHLVSGFADWLAEHPGRSTLRRLLVGVEPIPAAVLRRIASLVPGLAVVNGYGPTECTVCATFHDVDPRGPAEGFAPLGRAAATGPVYVLDKAMRPVPVGAIGELHVGGHGLALGYLGAPARTAEAFVPSPFGHGERLYRTGDRARMRADGQLVHLGRVDQQVKVRGMRIEPREVEAALTGHGAVTDAVVLAVGTPPDTRLVGYARVGELADDARLAVELRDYLRGRLPGPMVPAQVVLVATWPTTVNGKIDRAALPVPTRTPSAPPVGELETAIAAVWARLLDRASVGRTEDFFELGGHSLLAVRVSAELGAVLRTTVEPGDVLGNPTVAALAEVLAGSRAVAEPAVDVEQALRTHVASLPSDVIAALDPERGARR